MIVRLLALYSGASEERIARSLRLIDAEGVTALGVVLCFALAALAGCALGYMMPGEAPR